MRAMLYFSFLIKKLKFFNPYLFCLWDFIIVDRNTRSFLYTI